MSPLDLQQSWAGGDTKERSSATVDIRWHPSQLVSVPLAAAPLLVTTQLQLVTMIRQLVHLLTTASLVLGDNLALETSDMYARR